MTNTPDNVHQLRPPDPDLDDVNVALVELIAGTLIRSRTTLLELGAAMALLEERADTVTAIPVNELITHGAKRVELVELGVANLALVWRAVFGQDMPT